MSVMNRKVLFLAGVLCSLTELRAQGRDAVVKRNEISIHTIERGSMPILESASGTITSLQPRRAVLILDNEQGKCEAGRGAQLVVGENPRPLAGKVVRRTDAGNCEVEFTDALPQGAVTGGKVRGLIVTDEMKDVVFLGRPADSRPNSTAIIFVLEDTSHARRVTVQYGAMSGPLIQVLNGLAPGDKVIVTDMSKWADIPRVRLE
jgi:hypothetical protein